jgi:hypothetical protein
VNDDWPWLNPPGVTSKIRTRTIAIRPHINSCFFSFHIKWTWKPTITWRLHHETKNSIHYHCICLSCLTT